MRFQDCSYLIDGKKVRRANSIITVDCVSEINLTAERIFRFGENLFLLTAPGYSVLVELHNISLKVQDHKELILKQKTLCLQRYAGGIVQVTANMINFIGKKQIHFDEPVGFVVVIKDFVATAAADVLKVYKELQVVKCLILDNEILSLTEKDKDLIVAVKGQGLFILNLESLVLSSFRTSADFIPEFYFYYQGIEIISSSNQTLCITKDKTKILEFPVFRARVIKESIKSLKIFAVSLLNHCIITVPDLIIEQADFFDAINLYENTYIAGYSKSCQIGELATKIKSVDFKTKSNLTSLSVSEIGIYGFYDHYMINFNSKFEEINKISLINLGIISCSLVFQDYFVIGCENYFHILSFPSFSLQKSIKTEENIKKFSESSNFLLVFLEFSVSVYKDFEFVGEIKFLSPEYEEIGKKLDGQDLESIISLKLSQKYQKIIEFQFVNTGRSPVERYEMNSKECIAVTNKSLYWGKFESNFTVFTQQVKFI